MRNQKRQDAPLIPFKERIDTDHFGNIFMLTARAIEESLIDAGATPGKDYSRLDLYRLAQPFVLDMHREKALRIEAAERGIDNPAAK